jgi:transcriptional coactivator HFI1/ADA1
MHLPSSTGFTSGGGIGGSYAQRVEAVGRNLLESGLLKIEVPDKGEEDPAGGAGAGVKGKKKKHGLHWKYEDPAFILRDILG